MDESAVGLGTQAQASVGPIRNTIGDSFSGGSIMQQAIASAY